MDVKTRGMAGHLTKSSNDERKFATVDSVFSPLLKVMKWMACYTDRGMAQDDRPASTKIHFVSCILVIVYNWIDVLRYLTVFRRVCGISSYSIVSISFALFNVSHAFSMTALFFAGSKHLKKFIQKLVVYHSKYEVEFDAVFLRRFVIVTLIFTFVSISVTVFLSVVLTTMAYFPANSAFGNLPTPFTGNSAAGISIVIVTAATKTCSSFSLVALTLIYGLSVFILFRDYRKLSWDFQYRCTNKLLIIADDFHVLHHRHRKLTEALETANYLLGHFVFVGYGMLIPNFCLILFGIILGDLSMGDVTGLVVIVLLVTVGGVLVTWSGIKLSSRVSVIHRKNISCK